MLINHLGAFFLQSFFRSLYSFENLLANSYCFHLDFYSKFFSRFLMINDSFLLSLAWAVQNIKLSLNLLIFSEKIRSLIIKDSNNLLFKVGFWSKLSFMYDYKVSRWVKTNLEECVAKQPTAISLLIEKNKLSSIKLKGSKPSIKPQ